MNMRSPGIEVKPIRNAIGQRHFCEIFLTDVRIPMDNLVGPENGGWAIANATLTTERGMTSLELAERLWNAGFRWLLEVCAAPQATGDRPIDDSIVRDRLAALETELTALRRMCRRLVERHEAGTARPAEASVVKLYYSELLQRLMDFGAETAGLACHTELAKPLSSGWESRSWALDFVNSWEWTIAGGASEIQRSIIGERQLGLPREPGLAQ
jgi:alkylation response protein AidB-like acyl-CoA dehydrogenase